MAAERGGANRVELCAKLAVGGLTPGEELMRQVRGQVQLPIFAMIRPRADDFVYSATEFERMRSDIENAKRLGMDGVVFGLLTMDRRIDVRRTKELMEHAHPLPVTFHRAFDACVDLLKSLEDVIKTGAARILTSGGAPNALEGVDVLANLVAQARKRAVIVPGSGINVGNILLVAQKSNACEFHSGLGTQVPYGSKNYLRFENEIRRMASALAAPQLKG